jgi:N-acetylglucosaminyl-diphospho-decaprenol L-rhamnosyltransferase
MTVQDLAVILVSHHGERWLKPCLASVFAHVGRCDLDVVVVNNADDDTEAVVRGSFPAVRVIRCENHGFAHANNRALETCDARYVLFLNVDTEILRGTFEELVALLDGRPSVGLAGVRQLTALGDVAPSIRRFPNAIRAFGDSLGGERLLIRPAWLGERVLDPTAYSHEHACDWTSGSFLIVRHEVFRTVGTMDERFFLYSEEPDLCLRAKRAGWETRYVPTIDVLHHGGNEGSNARLAAQDAFSRMQLARKHFSRLHQAAYAGALGLGYALRSIGPSHGTTGRKTAARAALRTLVGIDDPPFRSPFPPSPVHA